MAKGKNPARMMPIGPLMIEHRLIERMIKIIAAARERITETKKGDAAFVDAAVDFFRTYADRCHHGKEEDILFRDLARKTLALEHKKMMAELVKDHAFGRQTVGRLADANERCRRGDGAASAEVLDALETLAAFYPAHIEKEDKYFFIPVMAYFTAEEKEALLEEEREFDREMIHEKYRKAVERLEERS
jgi:hemerythrin-like domain-containing protein